MNNKLTVTISICALAAAFAAGALTVKPGSNSPAPAAAAVATTHGDHGAAPAGDSAAAPAEPPAGEPAAVPTITISQFAFDTPAVAAGSTVRVVNLDSAPHTVTANDGSFTLFLDAGAEGTFVAPVAGSYDFFCEVHPSMTSTLVVG